MKLFVAYSLAMIRSQNTFFMDIKNNNNNHKIHNIYYKVSDCQFTRALTTTIK